MVIADTNIFYDLDAGTIAKAWFEKDQICGTFISQFEFAKSPNLIDRFHKVKGAARAMNHHCTNIIPFSPPDFIIRRFIPDYRVNPMFFNSVRESFETLLNPNFVFVGDKETGKQIIADYEKPFTDMRLNDNKRLVAVREDESLKELFEDEDERKALKEANLTDNTKRDIIRDIQEHHSQNYPDQPLVIDDNADGWNDLEFLINVWTDYNKRFFEKQVRAVKRNDAMDLSITTYVGRNDLYWTNDEDFIGIIKANPITAKYLHPLSGKKRFL